MHYSDAIPIQIQIPGKIKSLIPVPLPAGNQLIPFRFRCLLVFLILFRFPGSKTLGGGVPESIISYYLYHEGGMGYGIYTIPPSWYKF